MLKGDSRVISRRTTMSGFSARWWCVGLLSILLTTEAGSQALDLSAVFDSAAEEFHVPAPLLMGIGFVESRWTQLRGDTLMRESDMPPSFGVMGLRDDSWFGHSLQEAASLLGVDAGVLQRDPVANIRGGAAYLDDLAHRDTLLGDASDLLSWVEVLAHYGGIPQRQVQEEYVRDIFSVLRSGYRGGEIRIPALRIDSLRMETILHDRFALGKVFALASEDYPPADWDPSPNFGSRNGTAITHIIIHDTEGSFAGSVSWLQNPAASASAHYIIRSVDGYIKQLVREADMAWHVVCWNPWTVGIEHEGYVAQPQYFTDAMYRSSAALVRHLCDRYNIPKDRLHIVGHNVWQDPVLFPELGWASCNTHTDPGPYWNWSYFLALVVGDSTPPSVVQALPSVGRQNVPVYKSIQVTFDRTMDPFSTQAAFSIVPGTSGSFSWSTDGRTMNFLPASYLESQTSYLVRVDATAKSAGGGILQFPYEWGFVTSPLDTVGPKVVRSYPEQGGTGINPYMAFQYLFDEPVAFSSFSGRVRLVDLADTTKSLALGSVLYTDLADSGHLTFAPSIPLAVSHAYRLSFLPGLKDPLGNVTTAEMRTEFSIQDTPDPSGGTLLEGFEDNRAQWQDPIAVQGTVGADSALTAFSISGAKKREGLSSGMFSYGFASSSGGVVRLLPSAGPALVTPSAWAGLWVYGDNSRNGFEVMLNVTGIERPAWSDTLNWFGWRFIMFDTAVIRSGSVFFAGARVIQLAGGTPSGTVFLDDLSEESSSAVAREGRRPGPTFNLSQNYPNPFNPSTTIEFSLVSQQFIEIAVYTLLGERLETLVSGVHLPGSYRVVWDAQHYPSGTYFCRMTDGSRTQVRRMMLVR
jgi:N-acetyl-anhydromuramyl-L-alanine amidase AmpD